MLGIPESARNCESQNAQNVQKHRKTQGKVSKDVKLRCTQLNCTNSQWNTVQSVHSVEVVEI